jgi:hypothetical protein
MTPTMFCARSALADLVRDVRLIGQERVGMVPSASMANAQAATSRMEEIARRAFCAGSRSLGGALRLRLAVWPNRSRAQSRCVPSPGVASSRLGRFQIGCDPDQPFRRGRFLLCPYGRRARSVPRGPEAVVGGGDESPPTNENTRRPIGSECQGRRPSVSKRNRNVPVPWSVGDLHRASCNPVGGAGIVVSN